MLCDIYNSLYLFSYFSSMSRSPLYLYYSVHNLLLFLKFWNHRDMAGLGFFNLFPSSLESLGWYAKKTSLPQRRLIKSSHTSNSDSSSLFQLNLLLALCLPLREGFSHWNDSSPILSSFCLLPTSPPCHLKHTTKFQKMGCHSAPSSWTDLPQGLIPTISQCGRDNGQLEILYTHSPCWPRWALPAGCGMHCSTGNSKALQTMGHTVPAVSISVFALLDLEYELRSPRIPSSIVTGTLVVSSPKC